MQTFYLVWRLLHDADSLTHTSLSCPDGYVTSNCFYYYFKTYLSRQSFIRNPSGLGSSSEQPSPPATLGEGEISGLSHDSPSHITHVCTQVAETPLVCLRAVLAAVSESRDLINHGEWGWVGLTCLSLYKRCFTLW